MSESEQWMSNETSMKFGSPLTGRNLKNCLSFASIKHHKGLHEIETPRHSAAKIEMHSKIKDYGIGKENRVTLTGNKKKDSSKKEKMREERKEEDNKVLLQSYQVQNQSLKQTVQILKQQISALNTSYSTLKKQHQALKQQDQETHQKTTTTLTQLQTYKQKLKQYESIMPKIEELQELQDRMIQENNALKERETILKDLLAQIVILTSSGADSTAIQIKKMIKSKFDQF